MTEIPSKKVTAEITDEENPEAGKLAIPSRKGKRKAGIIVGENLEAGKGKKKAEITVEENPEAEESALSSKKVKNKAENLVEVAPPKKARMS